MPLRPLPLILLVPILASAQDGFRPLIGGLPFDSGFALGVQYDRTRLARTPVDFRAKAIVSVKKYEFLELQLSAPRLADGRVFATAIARYRNYPEEDFWGIGLKSSSKRRSTFRHEDLNFGAIAGVRPVRWLEAGVTGGLLMTNTGSGKDKDRPPIQELFVPAQVPGLDRQPHHTYLGTFLQVDYRDRPGDPDQGGLYQFRFTDYQDRDFSRFDFRRYEIDLRQFFPSFQPQATIAARAYTALSDRRPGQQVPYYLMPTVGGGNDLRGYLQYRFRDENILLVNLEYRYRLHDRVQLVGFGDGGRVFARPGLIGFGGMRGSTGAGFRFRVSETFRFGLDFGWSPEGVRVWVRGAHTF